MDAVELQPKTDVSAACEMDGKSSLDREERDRAQLLRLGKRPVLKVYVIVYHLCNVYLLIPSPANIWLYGYPRFYDHHPRHLGGGSSSIQHWACQVCLMVLVTKLRMVN